MCAQVMSVAKDQNGCRFLQRKFDEGGPAAIQAVLPEVLEHLIDLMMDPFGNYLIQKLLDRCSEEQRLAVRCFKTPCPLTPCLPNNMPPCPSSLVLLACSPCSTHVGSCAACVNQSGWVLRQRCRLAWCTE